MNRELITTIPDRAVLDAVYAGFDEAIFIINQHNLIHYANPVALTWCRSASVDVLGKTLQLPGDVQDINEALFDVDHLRLESVDHKEQSDILLKLHSQTDQYLVSVKYNRLPWQENLLLISLRDSREVLLREQTQKVLYQISEAVSSAHNLPAFFSRIHEIIGSLIPARNLYIALYDTLTQYISFPYYVDERDYLNPPQQQLRARDRKVRRGLTEYLLHTGEPLLVTGDMMQKLTEEGLINVVGSIPLEWLGIPLKNAQGEIIGGLVVQTYTPGVRYTEADIELLGFVSTQLALAIERKQYEERLKRERELFVSGPVVVFKLLVEDRQKATMLYVSPNISQFGYDPQEFTRGELFYKDIVHPDDKDQVFQYKDINFENGHAFMGEEYRILTADNQVRWVYDFTVIQEHVNQAAVEYNFYILDISARKNAEYGLQQANETLEKRVADRTLQLRETQEFLQLVIDTIPVPVYYKNDENMYTGCNTAYEQFIGLPRQELIGKTTREVWTGENAEPFFQADQDLLQQPGSQVYESQVHLADGKDHDVIFFKATYNSVEKEVAGLVGVMMDITERKRYERLQGLLYQISEAASSTQDLNSLFAFVHNVVNQLIPAKNLYIALYNPEEDMVNFPYFIDETSDEPPPPRRSGDGLTEYALRQGKAVLVTETEMHSLNEEKGVNPSGNLSKQWLGVPLRTEEQKIIGLLVVQSYDEREISYTSAHQELLEFVSTQIALAIERKRTQEALRKLNQELEGKVNERTQQLNRQLIDLRQRERELTAVVDIAQALRQTHKRNEMYDIVERSVMDALGATGASLAVLDVETQEMVYAPAFGDFEIQTGLRVPVHLGAAGWVIENGTYYLNNNVQTDPGPTILDMTGGVTSLLIVPMIVDDRVIGMLEAGNARPWNEEDIRILVAIAEIGAYAIQREILSEQKERQLQRLNVLREIDRMITGNFDLYNIMTFLLGQITNQLGMDAADILLTNESTTAFDFGSSIGFYQSNKRKALAAVQPGPAESVLIGGETIFIPQVEQDSRWPQFFRQVGVENFKSYFALPLKAKGQILGVLELFKRSPLVLNNEWEDFLHALTQQTAIAIENAQLVDKMHKANREMLYAYDRTIEGWAQALELRDRETGGHSKQVMEWTIMLAQAMGIRKAEELTQIRRGALLHDIGKMGIPDSILLKPGPLDEDEWEEMRKHPQYAMQLLSPIGFLRPALDIPIYHHERWDGSGYPNGLKGQKIPLAARIFAVIDVYHALISNRPYSKAWTHERAVAYIREKAGIQFDPVVVERFLELVGQMNVPHNK